VIEKLRLRLARAAELVVVEAARHLVGESNRDKHVRLTREHALEP
jgi:hypothetical protein